MIARWFRRAAAALGALALDAAVDSLELGKRCAAWVSHSFGARGLAVAALVVLVASLVARGHDEARVARATTVAAARSPRITRGMARAYPLLDGKRARSGAAIARRRLARRVRSAPANPEGTA